MLANLLGAMPQLEKLVFVVPEYHCALFEEAVRHANSVMPSVEALIVGPYCEFMIAASPSVTTISTSGRRWLHSDRACESGWNKNHSMKLIQAAGAAFEAAPP